MDTWLKYSLIVAALFCLVVISRLAVQRYRENMAIRQREMHRSIFCCANMAPSTEHWSEDGWKSRCANCKAIIYWGDDDMPRMKPVQIVRPEVTSEPEALMRPPNMGTGDIPYQGPNYFGREQIADDMRKIGHYGKQDGE